MKVILSQDIPHLGQRGDIKEVKEGFGRNFLLARGLAKVVTPEVLKEVERIKKEQGIKAGAELSAFETAIKNLEGKNVEIEAKANAKGGLFRAMSTKQIIAALKKADVKELTEADLKIKEPIKKVGEHKIEASRKGISVEIKIVVKAKASK